uniref:Uncharacterized protein n=1 Tax=Coturnix japonica TaxID=93934 RepID=A0A8C2SQ79_COTJA
VAGYSCSARNEILQLLPPPTVQGKESQLLCPNRDFKVECGGFSNRPIYELKHVPGTRYSPGGSMGIYGVSMGIYGVCGIYGNGPMGSWAKMATDAMRPTWVLHGCGVSSAQITELETHTPSSSPLELSSLSFLDPNTALLCCASGQLCMADTRQCIALQPAAIPAAQPGQRWHMAAACTAPSTHYIACISNTGQLVLLDARNASHCLAAAKCRVATCSSEFLSVSWAPALQGCVAVSGFDGTVCIYDTCSWDGRDAAPLFVHRGHALRLQPLVTAHTWHPHKARTVLSAASNGALHVWEWVQPHCS